MEKPSGLFVSDGFFIVFLTPQCKIQFFVLNLLLVKGVEIAGPEAWKVLWILGIAIFALFLFFIPRRKSKIKSKTKEPFILFRRIDISFKKNKKYNPDVLTLTIKNLGNTDHDISNPVLTFYGFWTYRKFKLMGADGYEYYPLVLEKGKSHTLNINLTKFFIFNEKLKRFPKANIRIYELNGRLIGKRKLFLQPSIYPF
jgi:hypothetical protein